MGRRVELLSTAVAQFVVLAFAVGVLWYGIAAASGDLITCESPWQRMKPEETCVAEDDNGTTHTYSYAEWKPIMESKAIVFVILGVVGIGTAAGWIGWTILRRSGAEQS